MGIVVGNHLDGLPVFQSCRQRHFNFVHPYTAGVIADTGMDGICEVKGCCASSQVNNFPLGCKHENLVREQVRFCAVQKLH